MEKVDGSARLNGVHLFDFYTNFFQGIYELLGSNATGFKCSVLSSSQILNADL
ncbi:MAG: hypothetical protein H5U05_12180 [Candidatus Aminicenantes bacterium]|nr:hypothetical protein [Candidatus Aminicenantes bacterium]